MGTSSIYEGPIDKKSLLPSDYNDLNNEEQEYTSVEPWKNAKKLMSQYITGNNNNLKGVVKNYIKAQGGSKNATQKSKAGIKSTINLGQFFSNIKRNGLEKTFKDLNIEYRGKDIHEVLSELVNVISFASDKNDDIVAKEATIETLSDLYSFIEENNMYISCLESIDDEMFDVLMCNYMSSYIWRKMLNDLESRFEEYSNDSNKSIEMENEFKEYIKNTVDVKYRELKLNVGKFDEDTINNTINLFYSECYAVLGGTI
ncbi:Qat anti-phage system associated protein QatB [Clostridium beijerinckii]|uniref:Uncharacterized protein n=1 Tax=Clostridium beijerinckii TaxID=1520 RepID=A0A1S8S144_CLOBE|nr:Qat anti-phage system associated protein QatB [Clostridium beijerinckii]NRY64189.1 hypothetical protein [Clostridium beijerinckii]OOM59151.1 hypothetical protein CLBCK_36020 [Clostridium beijerinckii]